MKYEETQNPNKTRSQTHVLQDELTPTGKKTFTGPAVPGSDPLQLKKVDMGLGQPHTGMNATGRGTGADSTKGV